MSLTQFKTMDFMQKTSFRLANDHECFRLFGYRCVRLENAFKFDLEAFSSRDEQMNKCLHSKALDYQESGFASVWVLTPIPPRENINYHGDKPRGFLA